MYSTEQRMELIVQAVCSLLGYLYLTTKGHAVSRQVARLMRGQQLDPSQAAKPNRRASSKRDGAEHAQPHGNEQQFKSQIGESHLSVLFIAVVDSCCCSQ